MKLVGQEQWPEGPTDTPLQGAVPALVSSKSVPEPGSGSWFICHPTWANRELGANTTPPLPWTLHSCVNLKLRELFHTSYRKGRTRISLRGGENHHLAPRQKPGSPLG